MAVIDKSRTVKNIIAVIACIGKISATFVFDAVVQTPEPFNRRSIGCYDGKVDAVMVDYLYNVAFLETHTLG